MKHVRYGNISRVCELTGPSSLGLHRLRTSAASSSLLDCDPDLCWFRICIVKFIVLIHIEGVWPILKKRTDPYLWVQYWWHIGWECLPRRRVSCAPPPTSDFHCQIYRPCPHWRRLAHPKEKDKPSLMSPVLMSHCLRMPTAPLSFLPSSSLFWLSLSDLSSLSTLKGFGSS